MAGINKQSGSLRPILTDTVGLRPPPKFNRRKAIDIFSRPIRSIKARVQSLHASVQSQK